MIDLLGHRCPDRPTVQFTMFNREHYLRTRAGRFLRAVLCRENDEKTTGEISRIRSVTAQTESTSAGINWTAHSLTALS